MLMTPEKQDRSALILAATDSLLCNTDDLVFIKDTNFVCVHASSNLAELTGHRDASELVGKTDFDLFPRDIAEKFNADDRALLQSGNESFSCIEQIRLKDGESRFISTTKRRVRDAAGRTIGLYGVSRDITKEHESRQLYNQELAFLFTLTPKTFAAVLVDVTDWTVAGSKYRDIREAFSAPETIAAYQRHVAKSIVDSEENRKFILSLTPQALQAMYREGRRLITMEYQRRGDDGALCWVRIEARFLIDPATGHLMVAVILLDIDAEHREHDALLRAVQQDSMTGLLHHDATMRHIGDFLEKAGAAGKHALFMIDIDNFKQVNDTLGHAAGDDVIIEIASAIRSTFRSTDIIGRIGGDEFLVLMKDIRSLSLVGQKARDLVEALQYVHRNETTTLHLTASVGISLYHGDRKPLKTLCAEADAALYRAKAAGKNGCEIAACSLPTETGGEERRPGGVSSSVHLRTLLDNMDATMFVCEVGDSIRFLYASPSAFLRMGRDPAVLGRNGEHLMDLILPDDVHAFREELRRTAQTGGSLDAAFRVIAPCGHGTEWRQFRGMRLPDPVSGPHRLLLISTNITEFKETEARLRFAELRYRTAIEESELMVWEADLRKQTVRHTGTIAKDLGIEDRVFSSVDELLATDIICPQSVDEYRRMCADVASGNDSRDYVVMVTNTAGQSFPLRVHFRTLRGDDGPSLVVGIAQYLVRDSRELEFYRSRPDSGVFSIRTDDDLTLLYANDRFHAIPGLSREDLEACANRCAALIHPDDLAVLRGHIRHALDTGTPLACTVRLRTKTGERHLELNANLREGGVMNGVALDVTRQKTIENALKTEKLKMDLVLSGATIFVWEYNIRTQTLILEEKSRKATGLTDSVLTNPTEVLFPDSFDASRELHRKIREGAAEASADLHFTAVFGRPMWLRCTYHTLFDEKGHPATAIGFAVDISDIKAAEDRYDRILCERETVDRNAVGSFWFNLTANRCTGGHGISDAILKLQEDGTVDGFFERACALNTDPAALETYRRIFSRRNLLDAFAEGRTAVSCDMRFLVTPEKNEWIRAIAHMMRNPETGDVEALTYACSIQSEKMSRELVGRLVDIEYEFVALIDARTGMLSLVSSRPCDLPIPRDRTFYPEAYKSILRPILQPQDMEGTLGKMSFPAVLHGLGEHSIHAVTSTTRGPRGDLRRKKWQFLYLDDTKSSIVYTRSDITDAYLAEIDPVAGIYNSAKFCTETRRLLDENPGTRFVIARFDIDNFKIFNDLYGIEAGNDVLASIGGYLRVHHLPGMVYGHIEADHYAFCVPEDQLPQAPTLEGIAGCLRENAPAFDFTLRMGIFRIEDPSLDIPLMTDRAYLALRTVKKRYGRHVACYDDSMRKSLLDDQHLMSDMREALDKGEFGIYLQPQYNIETGCIVGAEALVRWFHPEKGLIHPGSFIPMAEGSGFITQIDRHVWELACRQLRCWLDNGLRIVPLSVNVSRIDIYDPAVCDTLTGLIEKYGLTPDLLRLEITETAYMENPDQLISVVGRLHKKGFFIEMDDFGSGYSSLNILKDVPVDTLKLDMHFLTDCGNQNRGGNILSSVIRMARWLDLPVIAEGVETRDQADYLKSIGCLLSQGYLFARPMPVEDFEHHLTGTDIGVLAPSPLPSFDSATQFWNASAEITRAFNSFPGGSAIIEYRNGTVETLRLNDRFFEVLGTTRSIYSQWSLRVEKRLTEPARKAFTAMLEQAMSGTEATCEIECLPFNPGQPTFWTHNRAKCLCHIDGGAIFAVYVENTTQVRRLEIENNTLAGALAAALPSTVLSAGNETVRLVYAGTEALRLAPTDPVHPDDLARVASAARAAAGSLTFRHRTENGWITVRGSVCHAADPFILVEPA